MSPREIDSTKLPPQHMALPGPGELRAWNAQFTTIRVRQRVDGWGGRKLDISLPGGASAQLVLDETAVAHFVQLLLDDEAVTP